MGGDLWKEVSSIKYTIIVEKDLQEEIGGIKTNSKHDLECERLFVKTAAFIKQYLKQENVTRKDNIEVLIEKVREAVKQQQVELGLIANMLKIDIDS